MVEPYKQIYTVKEAASVLRVNVNFIYDLINKGKIPYLLLGQKKIRGDGFGTFYKKLS